jgi:hypothetical protein
VDDEENERSEAQTDYPCYVCERGLMQVGSMLVCDICNLMHLYCNSCQRMRPEDFFRLRIDECNECFLKHNGKVVAQ